MFNKRYTQYIIRCLIEKKIYIVDNAIFIWKICIISNNIANGWENIHSK